MRIYVISITTKAAREVTAHPPRVFTDLPTAYRAFQHQCGSNISVLDDPDSPTIDRHYKNGTVSRFDVFDIS